MAGFAGLRQGGIPPEGEAPVMMTRLRNYFLAGLVIAAPISITIWITWTVISWVDSWIRPLIPARYSPETYLRFTVPGFGLVVAVLVLTLLGFLAANLFGRAMLGYGERVVGRVPLVRSIYRAIKQIFETVLADRSRSFQKVGLIEFPRPGLWSVVLIATEAKGEVPHLVSGGERMYSVFLPPTPAPTAGYLMFVKESEITFLDMSVEEGLKLVISMGLVAPEFDPATSHEIAVAREAKRHEKEARRLSGAHQSDGDIAAE